jgi:sodium transport system permease protein
MDSNNERVRLAAVWLIYLREMQDQFRDRRTLVTILLLPVLLYPLVGTLLMQIMQFSHQRASTVAIIGQEQLAGLPPLVIDGSPATADNIAAVRETAASESVIDLDSIDESTAQNTARQNDLMALRTLGNRFLADLTEPNDSTHVTLFSWAEFGEQERTAEITQQWVRDGIYDVVILIPPGMDAAATDAEQQPSLELVYNVASDASAAARSRVGLILHRWKASWVRRTLSSMDIHTGVLEPFQINVRDIAPAQLRQSAFWSKMLPMVMLIWAMTGAFYPAIDLVAGEKERGTLETLLCSPALRGEIVWGKLAAVTSFSMLTALLNSGSMLTTGSFVFSRMDFGGPSGAPPATTLLWLLIALLPLATLFSAISLGISALARSSKEGQYYLMPLMLVILPLVMLPMMPGVVLSTGTSLIPVTGMFLLVRSMIEGQYAMAVMHLPMVLGVTIACLGLAVRWARQQFENETVLFHGGQPYSMRRWTSSLLTGRQWLATPTQGYATALSILVALFFGKLVLPWAPTDFAALAKMVLAPQLGMILLPTIAMAILCTRSPRYSLRIRWPSWKVIGSALIVGVAMHPMYLMLTQWVSLAYPVSDSAIETLMPLGEQIAVAPWLWVVLLLAVVPAICEELAFRGFVFGGLLRDQQPLRAILISAVVFGISHGVLQQSISATLMGLVLGWISWRTGSVIPTILIHAASNALSTSLSRIASLELPGTHLVLSSDANGVAYQPLWSLMCLAIVIATFLYYNSLTPNADEQSSLHEGDAPQNEAVAAKSLELAGSAG